MDGSIPGLTERPKILIVDDREANRVALRATLRDLDVDVIEAASGNEALAATLDHRFAAAVLDIHMPGMSGYELAMHLRGDEQTRMIPILFLTAVDTDEQGVVAGYEAGGIDFLVKPCPAVVLVGKVRALLEMDRDRSDLQRQRDELEGVVAARTAELQARVRELDVRNRIAEIFLTSAGDEMFLQILDVVLEVTDSPLGLFGYLDEAGDLVVPAWSRQAHVASPVEDAQIVFPRSSWGEGDFWRALEGQRAVWSNEFSERTPRGHLPIIRHVALPLVEGSDTVGLFMVANKAADYTAEDLSVLDGVGRVVAPLLAARLRRERQERRLRESEDRYRALFEGAAEGIVVADLHTRRLLQVNPAAWRLLGYAEKDLESRGVHDLVPPAEHERVDAVFAALSQDDSQAVSGLKLIRQDGRLADTDATATRIEIAGRECAVVFFVDVTERRALESQVRQSQKMEAIGRLAGGVAHDFNNLLTAILGFCEIVLLDLGPDHPSAVHLREILHAGRSASKLTRQLMAFSRRQQVHLEVVDVGGVVNGVVRILQRLLGEDIDLRVQTSLEVCRVRADAALLEQVVMNLAVNARDAMPRGGTLTVSVTPMAAGRLRGDAEMGPCVRLTVRDSGCGMDAETLSHIFEPFFTTKPPGVGTGLGLSTVYGIVQQLHGHIEVETSPGQGAAFHVLLPRVGHLESEIPPLSIGSPPDGSETVLLVEDEGSVLRLAALVLRTHGYQVVEAASGQEALDRASGSRVDLLLTDVVMPGLGGRELAEILAVRHPEAAVLFVSGYTDDAVLLRGPWDTEIPFLPKPYTPHSLLVKVRESLEGGFTLADLADLVRASGLPSLGQEAAGETGTSGTGTHPPAPGRPAVDRIPPSPGKKGTRTQ